MSTSKSSLAVTCPRCGTRFPAPVGTPCPQDGAPGLAETALRTSERDGWLGSVLEGRFAIVDRIGVGAMSRIYDAIDRTNDAVVAVKVMRADLALDKRIRDRWSAELRVHALAAVVAPGRIPQVVASGYAAPPTPLALADVIGPEPDIAYLAMERLYGETLGELLTREKSLDPPRVVAIALAILEALGPIHAASVVHGDVKPDNVFVCRDGRIVLFDFGVATVTGEARTDVATALYGTPRYLAPERAKGLPYDHRADLYAVAAVMHRALEGRPLFDGASATAVMKHHVITEPPLLASAPEGLARVVRGALAKSPDDRPASAAAFAAALRELTR